VPAQKPHGILYSNSSKVNSFLCCVSCYDMAAFPNIKGLKRPFIWYFIWKILGTNLLFIFKTLHCNEISTTLTSITLVITFVPFNLRYHITTIQDNLPYKSYLPRKDISVNPWWPSPPPPPVRCFLKNMLLCQFHTANTWNVSNYVYCFTDRWRSLLLFNNIWLDFTNLIITSQAI